jgi:regulator of ribonuclease activity A
MSRTVCDLCDEHEAIIQVAEPIFTSFGARNTFGGIISTVKCHEDNSLVRDIVATSGAGHVLVVDGGGSRRRSLLGDMLAAKAVAAKWEGIVLFGAVRDLEALAALDLGILALAASPLKTEKKGIGERNIAVRFAGINFVPGEYLYADRNGMIVAPHALD